jgi:hypothetical protein
MVLTFYIGTAALEFKQYAAYVQRRTATRAAELAVSFQVLCRDGGWAKASPLIVSTATY